MIVCLHAIVTSPTDNREGKTLRKNINQPRGGAWNVLKDVTHCEETGSLNQIPVYRKYTRTHSHGSELANESHAV